MFILRNRISGLIDDLRSEGFLSNGELFELQDHLLTETENLVARGMKDVDAFADAARRLGTFDELRAEFQAEHNLSQRQYAGWVYLLDSITYRITRNLQITALLLLPVFGLITPFLILARNWSNIYDDLLPGEPLPSLTTYVLFLAKILAQHWWFVLPMVAIMVYPTLRTAIRLSARGDFSLTTLLQREYARVNNLWPWVLVLYPLVGAPIVIAWMAPMFRLLDKLGG